MKIIAKDETGREIPKTVEFSLRKSWDRVERDIISFGWPCEYRAADLLKHYPFEGRFCIDGGGRNHYGSPVYIDAEDMDKVIDTFKEHTK